MRHRQKDKKACMAPLTPIKSYIVDKESTTIQQWTQSASHEFQFHRQPSSHLHRPPLHRDIFCFHVLQVGGTWLKMKQANVICTSPTDEKMKGIHRKQFRCFLPTCTHRKSGNILPTVAITLLRGGEASFQPSEIFTKTTHTKRGKALIPSQHKMFTLQQETKDSNKPAQPTCWSLTSLLPSVTRCFPGSADQLPCLMHFVAQHVQGHVTT